MMHHIVIAGMMVVILLLAKHPAASQSVNPSIDQWVRDLSVKKDPLSTKLREVVDKVTSLDSVSACNALRILDERSALEKNHFKIRNALLRATLRPKFIQCVNTDELIADLKEALKVSYEIEDRFLAAELNQQLSIIYIGQDVGLSIMYGMKANEMRKSIGEEHFVDVAMHLHLLGTMLYKSRDFRMTLDITQEGLNYPGNPTDGRADTLNTYWKMNAWNNIGLAYERLGMYDSALVAFDNAYVLSLRDAGPFWPGLIKGNRGDVFFLQGRYDSAEVLLQQDYEQSMASRESDNAALTLSRLARINNSRGNHQRALEMVKEAEALWGNRQADDYWVEILHSYAQVYRDLGMADSAYVNMLEYKERSAELDKLAMQNKAEIAEMRMKNQDNVHQVLVLNKEKHRIALIRNFSIALLVLFGIMGFVFMNRLRLKARLKQHEAFEARRVAEAEARSAKEELTNFADSMREKTKQIEDLQARMLKQEQDREQIQQIEELSHHTILTDADWERFKSLFTKVYPGFFIELKRKVNDISLAEQRMAALIKIQISNKDAASMLGVSHNSIHKTRQRLRQRLGLEDDAELERYFSNE